MCEFNVCRRDVHVSEGYIDSETYTLTDEGAEALADTVARGPTPFTLRAAALLRDSNERLLPENARRATSTAQLVEHAQMVAHELGNKLSAVTQRIEMLRLKASANGAGDVVNAELDRVQRILANVQTFADDQARIAGAADASAAVFETVGALREITARLKTELNGTLEIALPEALPPIRGMREQLALVIDELVRNARRAITSSAARIIVRAELRERGWIEIHVEDNGPGVPIEERARIFDKSVSARAGGGQGLAQVRRIVTLHFGGAIECGQSALGGADFLLLVPTDKQGAT